MGPLVQAGLRAGKGPGVVPCCCPARAAPLKKPDGWHPGAADTIEAKELGTPVALSLRLCGIMVGGGGRGGEHKGRSFAWFWIFQRERLKFDCIVIW